LAAFLAAAGEIADHVAVLLRLLLTLVLALLGEVHVGSALLVLAVVDVERHVCIALGKGVVRPPRDQERGGEADFSYPSEQSPIHGDPFHGRRP